MVNPLIIKGAAKAAKGAIGARVAMDAKAAKLFEAATKNINEAGKAGTMQAFENATSNIKQMGPAAAALDVLGARFTAGQMTAQIVLMDSLLKAFESEAGTAAIARWNKFMSDMITTGAQILDIAVQISNADLQGSLITFGQIIEKWAWLFGKDPEGAATVPGHILSGPLAIDQEEGVDYYGRIPQF